MRLSLCCPLDEKMVEWTPVVGCPTSLSLFQGNGVPNTFSGTATFPFLAMQLIESDSPLSSQGGALVSKTIPWPQSIGAGWARDPRSPIRC